MSVTLRCLIALNWTAAGVGFAMASYGHPRLWQAEAYRLATEDRSPGGPVWEVSQAEQRKFAEQADRYKREAEPSRPPVRRRGGPWWPSEVSMPSR